MPELESLSWLSSAEVVFALIAVGTVLLLVEIASPGGWIAGIAGVALLALAGLALLSLPFSWIGLALITIGLGLFLSPEDRTTGRLEPPGSSVSQSGACFCSTTGPPWDSARSAER